MSGNEINIKSTTVEKGLELAKDFITKILGPSIDEVGLIMSDKIKYFRFKNQVNILLKAKKYVETRNISVKEIPTKILVPLLENASLEDDEELQNEWAKLLTNMADSENNLQNQIFPYLLGQISIDELYELKTLDQREKGYYELRSKYRDLITKQTNTFSPDKELEQMKENLSGVEQSGYILNLENYELSNLERLGLIKQLPPKIVIEEFQTGEEDYETGRVDKWHELNAEYDVLDYGYRITELGELLVSAVELEEKNECNEL